MTQATPPAGWYPDPAGSPQVPTQRYWDGERWTEHTAPGQPAASAAPGPAYQSPRFQPAKPTTPDGVPLGEPLMRVVAYVVDNIVVSLIGLVLGSPFLYVVLRRYLDLLDELQTLPTQTGTTAQDQVVGRELDLVGAMVLPFLGYFVVALVVVLIYNVLMLRLRSQTLGLRVVGMQVRLRDRPGPLTWGTAVKRVAAQFLPLQIPVLGTIWLIIDLVKAQGDTENRQTLHDRIAGTSVVEVPKAGATA